MEKKSLKRITAALTALIMTAGMTFQTFAEDTLPASETNKQTEKVTESEAEKKTEKAAESETEKQAADSETEKQAEKAAKSETEKQTEEITVAETEEQADNNTAAVPDSDAEIAAATAEIERWKYDQKTKTLTVTADLENEYYSFFPEWQDEVENVVIENGVAVIADGFFGGCKNLKSVEIPDSVQTIDGAFYDCTSLKSITLPDSITGLYRGTFSGCSALEEVHLGKSLNTLGWGINPGEFSDCVSLEHIDLPDSISTIQNDTFNGCTALKSIKVPEHVEAIYERVFMNCTSLAEVDLNPNNDYSYLRYIKKDAFRNCTSLEKIDIPENVDHIDENAFAGCTKLKEVTVLSPNCIIEDNSFEGCDPSLVIKAYKGSKAEKYAERNGFAFEAVQKKVPTEEERKEAERKQAEEEKEREEAALKREAEEKEKEKAELIKSLSDEGMRGDINGDGVINVFDVMRYKREIVNGNEYTESGSTDINRNGVIDESDVSAVMNDALGKSVLWSYGTMPKIGSDTIAANLESMFRAEILGINYINAKKLVSDDDASGQFKKLISGDTDIVFADAVTEEQKKAASEAGVKLNIVPVAKTGLVFIVNKSNPVDSLTSEQIKDIYSGKITNWKEVGGNDEVIVAFQRKDNSDSQRFIKKWMGERNLAEPLKIGNTVSEYKNLENAIGFAGYSNAARMCENSSDIKFIAVDGVKPSAETMDDGTYPVLSSISAVYTDKASQKTRDLAAWALSAEGQKAVSDSGCIPVKKTEQSVKNKLYTAKGTGKEKPADLRPDWNGSNLTLMEDRSNQKLSWNDGMSKSECGLTCLKDKDVEEKINADIRKALFGDRDALPGEWKMKVKAYNAYVNITFGKAGSNKADVELIYDLRTGERLEKFSDLFYKDTDFLPLLNRLLERKAASDSYGIFATDYFGLSDDIIQFDFDYITLGENNPYTSGVLSLSLQDTWTRQLMGELVISEHADCRDFFEDGNMYKSAVTLTEWSTNEWIEDYSYGKDGKLHYDLMSYRHTTEEIADRNRACDTVYEKARELYIKELPDEAGEVKESVDIEHPEDMSVLYNINVFCAKVYAGDGYPFRQYYFDPETMEQLRLSDILGKSFEEYNDKCDISEIVLNKGIVYLGYRYREDYSSEPLKMKISIDDMNMKYIVADDAKITEFTRTKHGVVDSENALVYPESHIVKHDPQKKGEPVSKGFEAEIRNFTETLGKTWYECWNAESGDYCGWIAKENIALQYTEDENKLKFRSLEDNPIEGNIASGRVSYTNESVMDPDSELKENKTFDSEQYAEARNRCLSHGKWLYECWYRDEYLGWVEMHDFNMEGIKWHEQDVFPETLESERTGTVPGEKYNGIDFYSPKFIVSDTRISKSAGCVRADIKIKTNKRCLFHDEWWYECTSAGEFLGWVNGDLIEFD